MDLLFTLAMKMLTLHFGAPEPVSPSSRVQLLPTKTQGGSSDIQGRPEQSLEPWPKCQLQHASGKQISKWELYWPTCLCVPQVKINVKNNVGDV